LCLLWLGLAGCSGPETHEDEVDPDLIPDVPVPPADGPKLVALRAGVVVRDRPHVSGKVLGTLRAGGQVARSDEPYTTKGCAGGWYPIRPKGFVCAGAEASIDLDSPAAKLLADGPKLDKALPYRYARVTRGAAVAYGALPDHDEQIAAEPILKRLKKSKPRKLGTGSNDVPLDNQGLASGLPVVAPGAAGVNDEGYRFDQLFFRFGESEAVPFGTNLSGAENLVLKQHSGVAVVGSFVAGEREFGIMPDGRFIPTDRLSPRLGSEFHGADLAKLGLPIGFTLRRASLYKMDDHKVIKTEEEIEVRRPVQLEGRYRTKYKVRYFKLKEGDLWIRFKDLIYVPKRHEFPDFAGTDQKWIDVSLATQRLIAWQGKTPVFATVISSGEDRIGDPETGPATKQGVFHVRAKYITANVDDREVRHRYSITEVPWVMEFDEGTAITGCYWHGQFGESRSYHNIALSPIDARYLFNWAGPNIPDGWHSANFEETDKGVVIYVHK
jgi:lipoprotein-anchoring transpeptidase ErfK/SrfK